MSKNKEVSNILLKQELLSIVPNLNRSCINFSLILKNLFNHLSKWNHDIVIKYLSNAFIEIIKEMSFGEVVIPNFEIDVNKLWVEM
jgi:hypothetical protein